MRFVCATAICVCSLIAAPQPELERARDELRRIEELVAAGGLPRVRLDEAKAAVAEAEDEVLLRQTLYGSHKVEDLTEDLSRRMVTGAKRLMDRQQERVTRQRKLVEAGVAAPGSLTSLIEEMDQRRRTLDLAESRVRLWNQLLEMARAEQARQAEMEGDQLAAMRASEADPAYGILSPASLRRLESEYERTFARSFPISAKGDTVFHRSIGFDHRGRIDVALNPDTAEGRWLRSWLDAASIPYLAFRSAVPGQATAPHIHIGPPSLRLRAAD
ncbi:MAG: hypothetical protein SFV51_30735 [Bryobacteraceae bacterium]|nr:hypothetical protein [Bryobacteraceae bacterium]